MRGCRGRRYARFRYVYYTESDQLPHVRNLGAMLHTLADARKRGTYAMFTPHRLVPTFTDVELARNATPLQAKWVAERARFLANLRDRFSLRPASLGRLPLG